MLAVGQAGEFDAAPHIHGIDCGGRELVHPSIAPSDDGSGDQCHTSADHVDRDHIEAFAFVGGKLPKIRAEQIRQRPGSIDALVPSREW